MTRQRLESRAAFSLIEVVVAVALFASAAVVLSSAFVNALLAREHGVRNNVFANDISAVRMQLLLETNLEDAEKGGDFKTLNSGEAQWQAIIEPMEVIDLFRVILEIEFPEAPEGMPFEYNEILYLMRPTWSLSDERSDLLEDKRQALYDERGFE
jgi:general secretion pathway protein I